MDSFNSQSIQCSDAECGRALTGRSEALEILYIAGSGRSGSTLLTNLLGQLDSCLAAGEVYYLWERGIQEDRLCGCGDRIARCDLWSGVLERAVGELSPDRVAWMGEWTQRLNRTRRLPFRHLRRGRELSPEGAEYLKRMERLYLELGEATGARVIVDASKNPLYGELLARSERLRTRTLHLVRDPRAVAFSWRRRKWNPDSGRPFGRISTTRSALIWRVWNRATETLLGSDRNRYMRLRYEDLCADGGSALRSIIDFAGLPDSKLPFDASGTFQFAPNHAIAGNPVRFSRKPTQLRLDQEWQSSLGALDRLWVTLLTRPLLRRYGYAVS